MSDRQSPHSRNRGVDPSVVLIGPDDCLHHLRSRAASVRNEIHHPWRAICQEGSLESVFATLEADLAIAMFLSRTVPDRLKALRDRELPALPQFHVNLRLRSTGNSPVITEFAGYIREGFESRYA